MTMSTVSQDLARHQERYVRSWGIIRQLENFNETHLLDDLPDFPDLPRETVKLLLTNRGQSELERWMSAFKRSIQLMKQFNIQRELGTNFNISDWRLMDESAAKALEMLEDRLRKLV